jgi:hypothetical protein
MGGALRYPSCTQQRPRSSARYFPWGDTPKIFEIETDEGFTLEDLMQELGRLELNALGYVKHGDVPQRA